MDGEVPEYKLAAGVCHDLNSSLHALDDNYLTNELLELLHQHDDAVAGSSSQHGSFVDENTSLDYLLPTPPSSPLPAYYAAVDASARAVASEAEMASWLCQVFEQEALDPPTATTTTTTTKSDGESITPGSSSGASGHHHATSAGTPADERPRSSGRRRSCNGKAAEQRRRDKINDKMRILQQLMPRCSKTDKASTLEEVIQYVKSLQHQLQVLSASGYAMPILPPGVVPPSCVQRAAGDVLGGPAPVILPPYPFVPAVFACPHHGHGTPPPPPQYRYAVGSGSATQHHGKRRHSNDLAVRTAGQARNDVYGRRNGIAGSNPAY